MKYVSRYFDKTCYVWLAPPVKHREGSVPDTHETIYPFFYLHYAAVSAATVVQGLRQCDGGVLGYAEKMTTCLLGIETRPGF